MAEQDRALLDEVLAGSTVMAALAKDEEVFRAAVDAFRAYDGESMAKLLDRHQLSAHCEIICHWLRSKEAVLLCLELAGPPPLRDESPPDPREFAQLVAKLTADDAMVRLMVDAVEDRDTSAWSTLIEKNGLQRFSHLLCHWVCTVHYRLVCDVVCQPLLVQRPHLGPELRAAGAALGSLAADEAVFAGAVKAVLAGSCETLAGTLEGGGFGPFCFFLCEWFCSWRCMLVCLRLCRIYPFERFESPIGEMRDFALALGGIEKTHARTAHGGDAARGPRADPGAREGAAVRALLHPVLPLGLLPALPAVLHLRLPAADDRRLHQDRRPLLQQRRPQPQPGQRAHGRRRPGVLLQPAPQRRPVGRRRRAADRVPLPDDRDDRDRRAHRAAGRRSRRGRSPRPTSARSSGRSPSRRSWRRSRCGSTTRRPACSTSRPTPTAGSRSRRCSRSRRWCRAPAGASCPART